MAPSRSASTATAVSVAAKPYLGAHTRYSSTQFTSWLVFGGGSTTTSGADLNVPAGQSPYGIAFYSTYRTPIPPPCIGYPHCI